jgi:dipeptidyl aminopeptidase/acylaminoacyl peptidase
MHGRKDRLVLPNQAEELAQALREAGRTVEVLYPDGLGHGGPGWNDFVPAVRRFFDRVKGK